MIYGCEKQHTSILGMYPPIYPFRLDEEHLVETQFCREIVGRMTSRRKTPDWIATGWRGKILNLMVKIVQFSKWLTKSANSIAEMTHLSASCIKTMLSEARASQEGDMYCSRQLGKECEKTKYKKELRINIIDLVSIRFTAASCLCSVKNRDWMGRTECVKPWSLVYTHR